VAFGAERERENEPLLDQRAKRNRAAPLLTTGRSLHRLEMEVESLKLQQKGRRKAKKIKGRTKDTWGNALRKRKVEELPQQKRTRRGPAKGSTEERRGKRRTWSLKKN